MKIFRILLIVSGREKRKGRRRGEKVYEFSQKYILGNGSENIFYKYKGESTSKINIKRKGNI